MDEQTSTKASFGFAIRKLEFNDLPHLETNESSVDFVESFTEVEDNFVAIMGLELSSGIFYTTTAKDKVYQFFDNPTPPACNDNK